MDNHILKDPKAYENEFNDVLKAYSDTGIRVQFNPAIRNDNPFVYGDNKAFIASLPDSLKQVLTSPPPAGSLTGGNFVKAVSELHGRCNSQMARIGFGPWRHSGVRKSSCLRCAEQRTVWEPPSMSMPRSLFFKRFMGLSS